MNGVMSFEPELTTTEFLDMTVRQASDLLCRELVARKRDGDCVPIAGASLLGTNPCDGSRVRLTVTLSEVVDDD